MSRSVKLQSMISAIVLLAGIALIFGNSVVRGVGTLETGDRHAGAGAESIGAGKMAPDFALRDLAGKTVTLSSFRGKIVFLNLWATWCPPCRTEMPSIETLHKTFAANPDFVALMVSEDADVKKPPEYIKKNGFDFAVLLDPENKVGEAYDVSGLPESFVIGRDGRIVAHHVGPYDWANTSIRDALQDLLKAKTG
jgi:peroxiredoxin